jgi:hypothetical protein
MTGGLFQTFEIESFPSTNESLVLMSRPSYRGVEPQAVIFVVRQTSFCHAVMR